MKIFVAGGSGVIGRELIPRLVSAGHAVAATTRSPAKAEMIKSFGATPVVLDALDDEQVTSAVEGFRPDVVMNQLTSLPQQYNPRRLRPWYKRTNRLRVDASRILLRAAAAVGARRFIYQSIAFMYQTAGPWVVDEDAPIAVNAPEPFGSLVRATLEGERLATTDERVTGVVLRYGQLYGPGTYFSADGAFARQAKARTMPIVGSGAGLFSFLHVTDAATAAVAALDRGEGVYNITDDEPIAARDWIPAYCRELCAPAPLHVPRWLVRIAAGSFAASMITKGRGASNSKAKRELGWTPTHPSWRGGLST